jgi:hypothetical protein
MKTIAVTVEFVVVVSDEHHTPGCAESLARMVVEQAHEWAKHPSRMLITNPILRFEERS